MTIQTITIEPIATTSIDAFGDNIWSLWVERPPIASKLIDITSNANQPCYIQFDDATTLNYAGLGTVTVDTVSTAAAWNYFMIKRVAGVVSVYQNKVLKGTISITAGFIFGGTDTLLNFEDDETSIYDVRLYDGDIATDNTKGVTAFEKYYDDVINNEGKLYL